jgi:hypothetical protein
MTTVLEFHVTHSFSANTFTFDLAYAHVLAPK